MQPSCAVLITAAFRNPTSSTFIICEGPQQGPPFHELPRPCGYIMTKPTASALRLQFEAPACEAAVSPRPCMSTTIAMRILPSYCGGTCKLNDRIAPTCEIITV